MGHDHLRVPRPSLLSASGPGDDRSADEKSDQLEGVGSTPWQRGMKTGRPIVAVTWGFVLLLLLLHLAVAVIAERTVATLLLTYFVPPQVWTLCGVLLLLSSLKARQGRATIGSLVALFLALPLLGWNIPHSTAAQSSFRLMTYNIARGAGGASELADTVRQQHPDVVCLQEINGLQATMFPALLRQLPEYSVVQAREVALLSRLPVLNRQETPIPGTTRSLLSASIRTRDGQVTVLNTHFTTVPLRSGWAGAVESRTRQEQAFLSRAQGIPGALVACGDFNTPPRGLVYAALKRHFTNAFEQAGSGLGLTFPATLPLARIDHVWLRQAEAVRASVPVSRASDHRPLVVDVRFP